MIIINNQSLPQMYGPPGSRLAITLAHFTLVASEVSKVDDPQIYLHFLDQRIQN